jgi:glycosyltransferase involved in cell wall biosynthesis
MSQSTRIAVFASTSGHSGVDRTIKNLIPALIGRGYRVDLLKVRGHGPELSLNHHRFRTIDLRTSHTYSAFPSIVNYLIAHRPAVMLSDKDRVNRTALLARWLSGQSTRLILRYGTTVSVDLSQRGILQRWVQRTSIGKLYRYADNVIVSCKGVADDMASYTGLSRGRITVVASPIVPDTLLTQSFSRPDHPWFAPGEPPVILSVGELSYRKGFDVLIPAFARLRQERRCRLMILGKGARRERLLAQAAELGVANDFALPGYVTTPYSYMAGAGLFVMTSRWEGMPLVLIEALAVGASVVSTDCPNGPAEVLEGGRYGRLVKVDDVEGLHRAMAESLDAPVSASIPRQAILPYTVSASTDAYLQAFALPAHLPSSDPSHSPGGRGGRY